MFGLNMQQISLSVFENEDDAPLTFSLTAAKGLPGDTIQLEVTLSNPASVRLNSIFLALQLDSEIFKPIITVAGPALPYKDVWALKQKVIDLGQGVEITADQFAGKEFTVVAGKVFLIDLVIDPTASSGLYLIKGNSVMVNGIPRVLPIGLQVEVL